MWGVAHVFFQLYIHISLYPSTFNFNLPCDIFFIKTYAYKLPFPLTLHFARLWEHLKCPSYRTLNYPFIYLTFFMTLVNNALCIAFLNYFKWYHTYNVTFEIEVELVEYLKCVKNRTFRTSPWIQLLKCLV